MRADMRDLNAKHIPRRGIRNFERQASDMRLSGRIIVHPFRGHFYFISDSHLNLISKA